ncbi:hypothetical protein B0T10DRAFT_522304 [Thelonectria olida]|uniref:Uncharacterized protein n=1 Tax=Thelonectria olida TaxID=1576542 RepID=A0A9P8VQY3_9HYPO|nr:hypothetical protein B0T10DRAFT_522304 [Thelonectria olida]
MDAEHPPSYDTLGSASAGSQHPPDYQHEPATPSQNNSQVATKPEECPTLVLDGCLIFSRLNQGRLLYEVSNPPCEASTSIYGVEKIRYRIQEAAGEREAKIRSRRDHIYDFKSNYFSLGMRGVSIIGKGSSKRVFPKVYMSRGLSSSSFNIAGHFKTEQSIKNRVQHGSEISWKSKDGTLVAVETKVEYDKEGRVLEPPRLEIKTMLEEKELDLLVTCWCARVWKHAKDELYEPMSWKEIKGCIENHPSRGRVYGGLS